MVGLCPNCGKESALILVKETEEINVRGELIPIEAEYYRCQECGEEFEISRPDYTPLKDAYEEYRRRKSMVQPEEIRHFRNKFELTQKEFSGILGIGIATLNRYENGALQNKAHDRVLRLSMDPSNFLVLVQENDGVLNREKRNKIIQHIQQEESLTGAWLDVVLQSYASHEPEKLSGYRRFNLSKYFQALKFFCFENEIFKTKLVKLLFYADFKYFKEYAVSITGAKYAHLPFGPAPDRYETWFLALLNQESSFTSKEVWYHDNPGEVFLSQEQPDLSEFSASEIKILAFVEEFFENYSAKQMSNFSHQERGYRETKDGDIISYEYADDLQI